MARTQSGINWCYIWGLKGALLKKRNTEREEIKRLSIWILIELKMQTVDIENKVYGLWISSSKVPSLYQRSLSTINCYKCSLKDELFFFHALKQNVHIFRFHLFTSTRFYYGGRNLWKAKSSFVLWAMSIL